MGVKIDKKHISSTVLWCIFPFSVFLGWMTLGIIQGISCKPRSPLVMSLSLVPQPDLIPDQGDLSVRAAPNPTGHWQENSIPNDCPLFLALGQDCLRRCTWLQVRCIAQLIMAVGILTAIIGQILSNDSSLLLLTHTTYKENNVLIAIVGCCRART